MNNNKKKKIIAFIIAAAIMFSASTVAGIMIVRKAKQQNPPEQEDESSAISIDLDANENGQYKDRVTTENGHVYVKNNLGGVTLLHLNFNDGEEPNDQYTVPSEIEGEKVTKIGTNAFEGSQFTQLIIPDSVVSIGTESFKDCKKLRKVTFGSGLQKISDSAFSGCSVLSEIVWNEKLKEIEGGAFYQCLSLNEVTVPNTVETIGPFAFAESGITKLQLPSKMSEIQSGLCYNCKRLTSVTIRKAVKTIGERAFAGCSELVLSVPNTCERAAYNAFEGVKEANYLKSILDNPPETQTNNSNRVTGRNLTKEEYLKKKSK